MPANSTSSSKRLELSTSSTAKNQRFPPPQNHPTVLTCTSQFRTLEEHTPTTTHGTTIKPLHQGKSFSHDDPSSTPTSMLNVWAYETWKEGPTFAEQLEKKKWEAEKSRL